MFNVFLQPNKIIDTSIDNVYIFFNEPHNFSSCPYFLVIYVTLFSSLYFWFLFVFYNSKQSDLYAFSIFMLSNSFNFQDWDGRKNYFYVLLSIAVNNNNF